MRGQGCDVWGDVQVSSWEVPCHRWHACFCGNAALPLQPSQVRWQWTHACCLL